MAANKYPLIVFCGMDGTGKTTLAKKVTGFLEEHGHDFEFIHGHGYNVSQNTFALSDETTRKLRYFFRCMVPLALMDNLCTYYFKYRPILKSRFLVCDRYFYDKVARMMFYGICDEFTAKAYLRLLPRPDFTFFLDIDPAEAFQRKQEYSKEEYQRFRQVYRFVADELEMPIIDTSLPLDTCSKQILERCNLTETTTA